MTLMMFTTAESFQLMTELLTKSHNFQVRYNNPRVRSLEEKVTKNEASNSEKKKYQEMRMLKEVVKTRKPETVAIFSDLG